MDALLRNGSDPEPDAVHVKLPVGTRIVGASVSEIEEARSWTRPGVALVARKLYCRPVPKIHDARLRRARGDRASARFLHPTPLDSEGLDPQVQFGNILRRTREEHLPGYSILKYTNPAFRILDIADQLKSERFLNDLEQRKAERDVTRRICRDRRPDAKPA